MFPLGGDALPLPFFPLALVDLWEGLTGARDCADGTVDGGGGVSCEAGKDLRGAIGALTN